MQKRLLPGLALLSLFACSSGPSVSVAADRAPDSEDGGLSGLPLGSDGLPTNDDINAFLRFAANVDLNDGSYTFKDGAGGMSINLEFSGNGNVGDFLSNHADGAGDNGAGHPEGQIVSYNLSRILGYSRSYGRGAWHKITGRPIAKLRELAVNATPRHREGIKSKNRILETTQRSEISGVINLYGPKPEKFTAFEVEGSPNGRFNTSSPFASFLKSSGARPQNRNVPLGNFTVNELEAAKVLSTIFVIDVLAEQFDRFSGHNFNLVKDGSIYRLVAYDNGGAGVPGWGTGYTQKYLGWVSRFDKQVALRVLAMDKFVNGSDTRFLGFTDKAAFLRALGIRRYERSFKRHLAEMATHLRAVTSSGSSASYF